MNDLLTKVSTQFEGYRTSSERGLSLESFQIEALAKQPDATQNPDAFVQVFEEIQEPNKDGVQAELDEVLEQEEFETARPDLAHSDKAVASEEETAPLDFEMRIENSEQTSRSVESSRRKPSWEQVNSVQTAELVPNRQKMPAATIDGEHTVLQNADVLETKGIEPELPSVFPKQLKSRPPSPETVAEHSSLVTKNSDSQTVLHAEIARQFGEPLELKVRWFAGTDVASAAVSQTELTPDSQVATMLKRNTIPLGFALRGPAEQSSIAGYNENYATPAAVRSELPVQSERVFDEKQNMRIGYNATRRIVPPAASGMLPFEQSRFVPSAKHAPELDQNSTDIHLPEPTRGGEAQDNHLAEVPKARHQNVFETPSKAFGTVAFADSETRNNSKTKVELPRAAALAMPPLAPPFTDRNLAPLHPAKTTIDVSPDNTSLFLTTGSVELPNPNRPSAAHYFNAPEVPKSVTQQIAMAVRTGAESSVEIVLKPVELGRVRMSISTSDAGVVVHVVVERPETMELLRRNIDQLASEFKNIGYGHSEFRFANGDPGNGQTEGDQGASHSDAKPDPKGRGSQLTDQDPGVMISKARIDLDRVDIRI